MKRHNTLIISILSLLFVFNIICSGEDKAKPAASAKPDYKTKIDNAVKANKGQITEALVKAFMLEASADGTDGEVEMVKALLEKFPSESVMIAKSALEVCSNEALGEVAWAVVRNPKCPPELYQSFYDIAVKNNPKDAKKLFTIFFPVNTGGLKDESGVKLQTPITGQDIVDEGTASP